MNLNLAHHVCNLFLKIGFQLAATLKCYSIYFISLIGVLRFL
jgi:hypothetical protein